MEGLRIHMKTPISIAGVSVKIKTEELQNTSLERCF
jgi:hypothetical protein